MKLSENLKYFREKKGLSQSEVADRMNLTRQTISKWENGKSYPDIECIIKLSELYDVSLDRLLKNEEENEARDINREQIYMILSIISIVIPMGIILAIGLMISMRRKKSNKSERVKKICIVSVILNVMKIAFNMTLIFM